jgi:anti-sigma factor RsiW
MAECLDEKTLIAIAKGELPADATAAAERHLEECGRCAKALAALDVDDDLLEQVRDLERARADRALTAGLLHQIEQRTTSTLFGPHHAAPPD